MATIPKPNGSIIEEVEDFEGTTYRWKSPNGGFFRYFAIVFLMVWLCGWFAGFVGAFAGLFADGVLNLFMLIWLAGWTLGGCAAAYMLYMLLRPAVPESVTLSRHSFKYDSGVTSPVAMFNPRFGMHYGPTSPTFNVFGRRPKADRIRQTRHGGSRP